MTMNIYITPDNQEFLQAIKQSGESMSGLINDLIEEYSNKVNKNKSVSQAKEDGFVEVRPFLSGEQSGEFPCCDKAKPCQHWSFDGELWVNSLSGRKKEVA